MEFRDSNGIDWTVYEISPADSRDEDALGLLPNAYRTGWLAFKAGGENRRLMHYPPGWRQLSPSELERLRDLAAPVVQTGGHSRAR